MIDEPVTAALLAAAATDDVAFRTLQRRYERLVWSTTYGFQLDRHTREDVVQLVWLKLFENLAKIREPAALAGWIAITTRNECLRLLKARARVQLIDGYDAELASSGAELDTEMIRNETVKAVATALNGISAECQQLLRMLTASPPLSYDAIAKAMGWSIGSVGPKRQRCLDSLAKRPEIVRITGAAPTSRQMRGDT